MEKCGNFPWFLQFQLENYGSFGVTGEKIYAYSTDGLGNNTVIDDANTPSLLSLG
jgi:meiotically up-regulated gene 157 (Mug157) protein